MKQTEYQIVATVGLIVASVIAGTLSLLVRVEALHWVLMGCNLGVTVWVLVTAARRRRRRTHSSADLFRRDT